MFKKGGGGEEVDKADKEEKLKLNQHGKGC